MRLLSTISLSLGILALSGCAQAQQSTTELSQSEIENIVKAYILENPEIIRDALVKLQTRQESEQLAASKAALIAAKGELYNDPRDMVIGSKDAKVTIVEFFDYNCGFCKKSTNWIKTVIDKHPDDVRVIFKELPLLDGRTKTSRNAAKAAIAANRQGKYAAMHFALMEARGLTPERIRDIAKKSGLDMKKFDTDMLDVEIDRQIDDTIALAQRIPALTGTPFFVIGDEYVSGANTQLLQKMVDDAL